MSPRDVMTVLWSLLVLGSTALACEDEPLPMNTIAVTGHGRAEVEPDFVTIRLAVAIPCDDVKVGKQQADTAVKRALEAYSQHDAERLRFYTERLSVDRPYLRKEGEPAMIVSRSIRVVLHDLEAIDNVLDTAFETGVNRVSSMEYGSSREDELLRDCQRRAVFNAHAQASRLADAARRRLGRPLRIDARERWEVEGGFTLEELRSTGWDEPTYLAGTVTIEGSVEIVYELSDLAEDGQPPQ